MIRAVVFACSVCGGDPSSLLTKGAWAGVWFLGGVIVAVLVAIAAIARSWSRRARALGGEF